MPAHRVHYPPVPCTNCKTVFTPTSKQAARMRLGFKPYCSTPCARKSQSLHRAKPPTAEQLDLLLQLYKAGTRILEISERIGIDPSTISKLAAANGLPPRRAYMPHRARQVGDRGSWYEVLEVKSRVGRENHHKKTHRAKCSFCGSERWYSADTLDKVSSCGCKRDEFASQALTDHGDSGGRSKKKAPEYQSWLNFKAKMRRERLRPTNPHMTDQQPTPYDPRWENYKEFLADVGRKPHPDYCFSRKDETGGYFKDNVEWKLRSQLAVYDKEKKPEVSLTSGPKHHKYSQLKRMGAAEPIKG